tara:strand:- start:34 stop:744 length:711 start_codon:yes stop_codon:yes gene_type:complete
MAFKQRSSGLPFKEIGSSPAKQKTDSTNVSKQKMKAFDKMMAPDPDSRPMQRVERPKGKMSKKLSDLTPAEIKAMKLDKPMNTLAPKKPAPGKQVSQTAKKVISSGKVDGKDATDFTKGARTKKGGTGTYEKGKKQIYTKQDDDTYTKETRKIKKGATSDKEWESKKTKTISAKKAERQIKRKTKKASRSAKRADIKEVRATARTMRKDEGNTRADKKDIRTRKKATIKAIRNRER